MEKPRVADHYGGDRVLVVRVSVSSRRDRNIVSRVLRGLFGLFEDEFVVGDRLDTLRSVRTVGVMTRRPFTNVPLRLPRSIIWNW